VERGGSNPVFAGHGDVEANDSGKATFYFTPTTKVPYLIDAFVDLNNDGLEQDNEQGATTTLNVQ
jgi:hypothetical protein